MGDLSGCKGGRNEADYLSRLADTERLLRVELQDVKNASITRETELQLEISRLRKLVEVPFPVRRPESSASSLLIPVFF